MADASIEPFGWTIYREPADHPHGYIARRWLYGRGPDPVPTEDTIADESLDVLRGKVLEAMSRAGTPASAAPTRMIRRSWRVGYE